MRVWKLMSAVAAATSLVACGGGGGGSSAPVASTETFNITQAWVNYLTSTQSLPFTLSGTLNGVSISGSGTYSQSSLQSVTFEGSSALKKSGTATFSITANGQTAQSAVTTAAFVDSNYQPLGSENSSEYRVVTGTPAIAATGKVGDNGIWYIENTYPNSSKSYRTGTQTTSFVLEADTASTALLKIIQISYTTSGSQTDTSTVTFRITPSGSLTRLSESSVSSDGTLTANY